MKEYRIYFVGPDGHFQSSLPLIAVDDEAARSEAAQVAGQQSVELWELDRKVTIINPPAKIS